MRHALEPLVGVHRHRRPPDWLTAQLPLGLVEDDLLRRFVAMFQAVADTMLEHVDNLGLLLDPSVAPPAMVRFLGSWLGEGRLDDTLDDLVARRWVGASSELLRWRGTAHGLSLLLELVTGRPVSVADDGGVYQEGGAPARLGHVVIHIRQVGPLGADDLVALVRRELPAAVTFELHCGDEQLWPGAAPIDLDDPDPAPDLAPADHTDEHDEPDEGPDGYLDLS